MLEFFPDARIWVHESEEADYAPYVPEDQLYLHRATQGLGDVRNWIREHTEEESLFMCDDDFLGCKSLVWRRPKKIVHPDSLRQIVENGAQILHDLDKPIFGWYSDQNPQWFTLHDSFAFCKHFGSAWIWRGRDYKIDTEIATREDKDLMLKILLRDRIFVVDRRIQFCFEPMKSNVGGLQGFRESEKVAKEEAIMKERWGKHVIIGKKGRGTSNSYLSLNVTRKSPLGYK